MKISYVGNFDPSWSTENHIAQAWTNLGHEVQRIPEQRTEWAELPEIVDGDLLLWTRTAGFDPPDRSRQRQALEAIDIPKIGVHLDRWWGLNRETTERGPKDPDPSPFFTHLDLLYTADGDPHPWPIRHEWMPPAILSDEAQTGSRDRRYTADVGFVGNLTSYGHAEWQKYRHELWGFLRQRFHGRFQVFPGNGRPQIRGRDLANLYSTVKVLVGDSCWAGNPERYWSDRVPETLGRGGFLIHPHNDTLSQHYPHLVTYPLGDFERLGALIDQWLGDSTARQVNAEMNREYVLKNHTYERRMQTLLTLI